MLMTMNRGEYEKAKTFLNDTITSVDMALQGAKDIIAEKVSDDPKFRERITTSINDYGYIITKVKKNNPDEAQIYKMYYDRKEKVKYCEPHRIMAIHRAEKEKEGEKDNGTV